MFHDEVYKKIASKKKIFYQLFTTWILVFLKEKIESNGINDKNDDAEL